MSESDSKAPRARSGIRFSLLQMLLLTTLVAVWIPVIVAWLQIPKLQSEIATMRSLSTQLIVNDEQKLTVRSLPGISPDVSSWKYHTPPDSNLEIRLATEISHDDGRPAKHVAALLPSGEHSIHLKTTSDDEGHHTWVYLDQEVLLEQHHPPEWVTARGSTSSGGVSGKSKTYPLTEPQDLLIRRFNFSHPIQKNQSSEIPREYDNQGTYLWISPADATIPPAIAFYLPDSRGSNVIAGHRQGIRVSRSFLYHQIGLIGIEPSYHATLGDARQFPNNSTMGISVRPIVEGDPVIQAPEGPRGTGVGAGVGNAVSLRDSITPPLKYDDATVHVKATKNAISSDGKSMRLYAHYRPFVSGAQPIVEILFDAEHPDRVGFLPRDAPGSTPMIACQFVTRFDARFLWREIELLPQPDDSSDASQQSSSPESPAQRMTLENIYPEIDFPLPELAEFSNEKLFDWKNIPITRLPRVTSTTEREPIRRLSLSTDSVDLTTRTYPFQISPRWKYEGIANQQVWLLPDSDSEQDSRSINVEVLGSGLFPTTVIPIPGGPAFRNVRITVPMPAEAPVWLELFPDRD